MVEVCQQIPHTSMSSLSDGVMKHPNNNAELFEFNIGQALHMRCVNTKKACGQCESCQLNAKLKEAKEWLGKFGDHSKKRFMLGLMRRFQSVDLLQQMVTLLQPLLCKDFTYARSRTAPSLQTDRASLSSDRAVPTKEVEAFILTTWNWFQKANYWSKANYAMSLLQLCDSHLLHTLGIQARTLLVSEERAASFAAGRLKAVHKLLSVVIGRLQPVNIFLNSLGSIQPVLPFRRSQLAFNNFSTTQPRTHLQLSRLEQVE